MQPDQRGARSPNGPQTPGGLDSQVGRAGRGRALGSLSTWVLAAGLALAAGLTAAITLLLMQERRDAIDESLRQNALYARVLEDHVTRTVDAASLALANLSQGSAGKSQVSVAPMDTMLVGLPQVRSLAVLDLQGTILASSQPGEAGLRVDLSRLGRLPSAGHDTLGPSIPGRSLRDISEQPGGAVPRGVSFIPMVHRVQTPGRPELLLLALLNPDSLANHFRLTLSDEDSQAVLATYSGLVLSGTTELEPGTSLQELPVFKDYLPQREHGSYVGRGAGPLEQVVGFRVSRTRPLVVLIQRRFEAITDAWLERARWRACLGAAVVLAVLIMTLTAVRSLRARELAGRRLDEAQAHVARSERELRLLLEVSPLPIWMIDPQGRYLNVNRAWELFTGIDRGAVLQRPVEEVPALAAVAHDATDRSLLAAGQGRRQHDARETSADGRLRDLLVNKVVVPGPHPGIAAGILGMLMDVTELREAERTTRQARDIAEEASRAKSEFIANISHELRTPLQSIIGFSEIGMVRGREHARLAGMFQDIHTSGHRMLALVNDLLDVSKLESPVGTLHLERTDLRPLVREVVQELQPLLAKAQLRVEEHIGEQAQRGKVDPLKFQQVIRNILANAIKFSPQGSVIEVTGDVAPDGSLRWSVRDHGRGIPPAELESIFEAFVQSSRTKDGSGGTGLGLAICRKIVDALGGRIHAENAEGGGSRFHVCLPGRDFADTRPADIA